MPKKFGVVQHLPFINAQLDTSGEGWSSISEQVSNTVAYQEENYEAPLGIEEIPENAVSEDSALGLSEDNNAPLDEDSVAGHPLSDGKVDPADEIGVSHVKK